MKLSELKSGVQMGKSMKAATLPDSIITQREELGPTEAGGEDTEGRARHRRANRLAAPAADEKARTRRQRDFDPNATVDDDSADERKPGGGRPTGPEELWTQNQQKLLEQALQQYPRGTSERWDKIAKVVPGKTKVRVPGSW